MLAWVGGFHPRERFYKNPKSTYRQMHWIEEIDDQLAKIEDTLKGEPGDQVTEIRGIIQKNYYEAPDRPGEPEPLIGGYTPLRMVMVGLGRIIGDKSFDLAARQDANTLYFKIQDHEFSLVKNQSIEEARDILVEIREGLLQICASHRHLGLDKQINRISEVIIQLKRDSL